MKKNKFDNWCDENNCQHLLKEWHATRNVKTPGQYTKGSGERAWWLCPKGHEYRAVIRDRVSGTNCPICNLRKQTSFPEQTVFYYVKKAYPGIVDAPERVEGFIEKAVNCIAEKENVYVGVARNRITSINISLFKDDVAEILDDMQKQENYMAENYFNAEEEI